MHVYDKLSMTRWFQQQTSPMEHDRLQRFQFSAVSQHDNMEVGMVLKTFCNGCVSCSVHAFFLSLSKLT